MQSKKRLLSAIRKETKPLKGFGQWIVVLEHRRISEGLGLLLAEAQLDGKIQWSGSISVNLPEKTKFGPDGKAIPGEWETLEPGQSRFNLITAEIRGKSIVELVTGFKKRSFEDGKIQDFFPFGKG